MLPDTFADDLLKVLPRLLSQPGALPDDWQTDATTYDLNRFYEPEEFTRRLVAVIQQIIAEDIQSPETLNSLLSSCGHPYDYARLGQPLSTVYELYLQARTGLQAFSFASANKPYLSVIEARLEPLKPVKLYAEGQLDLSAAKRQALEQQQVTIYENWLGPIPDSDALTVYHSAQVFSPALLSQSADALSFQVPQGGVLLIHKPAKIDAKGIQLIRKRTVSALLAPDAKAELMRLVHLSVEPTSVDLTENCDKWLKQIFPAITNSLYFCTGLAAEAAVFSATAQILDDKLPLNLFYAQNGYGGTGQLITELLPREGHVIPRPLQVLSTDAQGQTVTLVEQFMAALADFDDQPVALFIETPTNPELQVHDFPKLMKALHEHQSRTGRQIPVLVDTTLAPLYPLFSQDYAQNWPFILVKSGSKYFTKGKAILGVAGCADHPLAQMILKQAQHLAQDADVFAKPSQLEALSAGLADLKPRMQQIAQNTQQLAEGIRKGLQAYGYEVLLYAMTKEQIQSGLASGMLSFYLPAAKTTYADLVDEFVDYLLVHAPKLVKNRVSYGQSSGTDLDPFYVINPQESTQGSLPEAIKAAQKKDNVQICRISVPEHADIEGLLAVIKRFFKLKYA